MSWVPPNWQPPGWDQPGWQPGSGSSAALVATLSIVAGVGAALSNGISLGSALQAKTTTTASLRTGIEAVVSAQNTVGASLSTGVSLASVLQAKTTVTVSAPSTAALAAALYGNASATVALSNGIALGSVHVARNALTAALLTNVVLASDLYGRVSLIASASLQYLVGGPRYIVKQQRARNFTVTSTSMRFRFDIKAPSENVLLTFDFSPDLATGETLTGSPTVGFATSYGVDGAPAAIANGAASFDVTAAKVIVPVQAGLALCDYDVTVTVQTTNANKKLTLIGTLPVRAKFT